MGTAVSGERPVAMGLIPFVDDHETEGIEQNPPKRGVQAIRMSRRNQSDLTREIEIEESDLAVPAALCRVADDGTGDCAL